MKKIKQISFIFCSFICCICNGQLEYNVDVLPSNVGGKAELKRIFKQELQYPQTALEKKEGGKLTIDFILQKDSSVTDVRVQNTISPAIDREALRIFNLLQWMPAIKDGKAISAHWSTTFNFEPLTYAKLCKKRGYAFISEADSSGKIVKTPDQNPMYPQGMFAIRDFIRKNLEYPRQAQLGNIQGTVVLRFVVEPSGRMTNIGVKKSLGAGCDEEAIRVLQLIKWYPGQKNNKPVRVQMTYPFYFILNEDFKDNSLSEQK